MVHTSEANEVLKVENLKVHFQTDGGIVQAVDDITFSVLENETVCLVGESGCGKSVTAHSILRLVPSPPSILAHLPPNGNGADASAPVRRRAAGPSARAGRRAGLARGR